jgi:hypothetical protein
MDQATAEHLDRWLNGHNMTDSDKQSALRALMVAQYDDDPQSWGDRGWWAVYNAVDGHRIWLADRA